MFLKKEQFEEFMPAAICLCYFMPYYINDDESHFVPRNPCVGVKKGWWGLYRARSDLLLNW